MSEGNREISDSDRKSYISVAVSFGRAEDLKELNSGVLELTCPECGAKGSRYGNPGEAMRFEGFDPITGGGLMFIQARCEKCAESVTLPHRTA